MAAVPAFFLLQDISVKGTSGMTSALIRHTIAVVTLLTATASPATADEVKVLTIGSQAPALNVEHWVSNGNGAFKPVTTFKDGNVYVVEFWATWCGPCIASMPHLVEVQKKFAEKGVQIVSISDEDLPTVQGFLAKPVRGATDGQTYAQLTSAYCLTTDPDRSVASDYMEAAGQNGIPTCFIVGKSGAVEWIGHPMQMDGPLEAVVTDKWDREAFKSTFQKQQRMSLLQARIGSLMQRGNIADALALVDSEREANADDAEYVAMLDDIGLKLRANSALQKIQGDMAEEGLAELDAVIKEAKSPLKEQIESVRIQVLLVSGKSDLAAAALTAAATAENASAEQLNNLAWTVYQMKDRGQDVAPEVLAAAVAVAERAVDAEPESGSIIDTLAHLVYASGNLDRAIELQTAAVKNVGNAPPQVAAQMREFLAQLKKEKAGN